MSHRAKDMLRDRKRRVVCSLMHSSSVALCCVSSRLVVCPLPPRMAHLAHHPLLLRRLHVHHWLRFRCAQKLHFGARATLVRFQGRLLAALACARSPRRSWRDTHCTSICRCPPVFVLLVVPVHSPSDSSGRSALSDSSLVSHLLLALRPLCDHTTWDPPSIALEAVVESAVCLARRTRSVQTLRSDHSDRSRSVVVGGQEEYPLGEVCSQ
jgi:hypothetical protein